MHEIQRMLPRHYAIVNLALAGMSRRDIAKRVSLTPEAVGMILRAPIVQDELARRRERIERKIDEHIALRVVDAKRIIEEASARAAEKQVELLDADSPRVRQSAAKDILDRTIGKRPSDASPPSVVFDARTINMLQVALQESQIIPDKRSAFTLQHDQTACQ